MSAGDICRRCRHYREHHAGGRCAGPGLRWICLKDCQKYEEGGELDDFGRALRIDTLLSSRTLGQE